MMTMLLPIIIVGILGGLFGLGLGYAATKFAVPSDERVSKVREVLPGANCGGCGYPGCDGFASAVVKGEVLVNGCPVGGNKTAIKVAEVLGVSPLGELQPQAARVLCRGNNQSANTDYEYGGIKNCKSASLMYGGNKACRYGCLGLGDCAKACKFDAVYFHDGIARIAEDKCRACGACVQECPKGIIKMVPKDLKYSNLCSSHDKGAATRLNCSAGCIGCMKCVKECPNNAIEVKDNLAVIDTGKCSSCGRCTKVCPAGSIQAVTHIL